jgi:hypothetical protein
LIQILALTPRTSAGRCRTAVWCLRFNFLRGIEAGARGR